MGLRDTITGFSHQLDETVTGWFGRTVGAASVTLQEVPSGGSYDPDSALTAAQMGSGYVKRLTTDSTRDLSPVTQQRALDLSYHLYDANPMAKRIIDSTKDAVVGQGIVVQATAMEEAQKRTLHTVLDDFWQDDINQMDRACHQLCTDLALAGELLLVVYVNPINGGVRIAYVDTGVIEDVLPDPRFPQRAAAVRINAGNKKLMFKVVSNDEDPTSPTFGHLVGARTETREEAAKNSPTEGVPLGPKVTEKYEFVLGRRGGKISGVYDGSCFFFTVNGVSSSRRGKPDLLCLIDWIDAYDQLLLNEVDRAILLKSYIWDITIEGATELEIREHIKTNPPPKANSLRVHNEKVTYKSDTPDLKANDQAVLADQLLSYCATGAGLPKFWLNGSMDVNRATAKEMSDPASMHLATRRKYFKYILERVCLFVLDQAEIHGRLAKRKEQEGAVGRYEAWQYEIVMPEADKSDVSPLASALAAVVNAAVLAIQNGLMDVNTAQRALVMILQQMGIEVNVDEMRQEIEKALAQAEASSEQEEEDAMAGLTPEEYEALVAQVAGQSNGSGTVSSQESVRS